MYIERSLIRYSSNGEVQCERFLLMQVTFFLHLSFCPSPLQKNDLFNVSPPPAICL